MTDQHAPVGELVWDKMAQELDAGNRDAAGKLFQEFSQSVNQFAPDQATDMKKQLIALVDQKEVDGVGDDLAVKYDEKGLPKHYAIIPSEMNTSAKAVAAMLDEDKVADAAEEFARMIGNTQSERDQQLYILAIDAYEQDGKGRDIVVNYDNNGSPSTFEIDFTPQAQ